MKAAGRQAGDAWVVALAHAGRLARVCLEQAHGRFKMVQPAAQVAHEGGGRADDEVAVDAHARVVFGLRDDQDPLAQVDRLVELHAQEVEAGQPAQRRVVLPQVLPALEQLERLGVRLGDLQRVALRGHERPRQRHAERDLLADGVGRRRGLGQHRRACPWPGRPCPGTSRGLR